MRRSKPPEPPPLPGLTEAESDVATALATLDRWNGEVEAKARELAEVQESAGEDLVDDPELLEEVTQRIIELSTAHDLAARAVAEAAGRVDAARRILLRVQGVQLRDRAAVLDVIAVQRQQRTDELLAELDAHEGGCRWVVWRPSPGETGSWKVTLTEVVRREVKHLIQLAEEREFTATNGNTAAVVAMSDRLPPHPRPIEWEMTRPPAGAEGSDGPTAEVSAELVIDEQPVLVAA